MEMQGRLTNGTESFWIGTHKRCSVSIHDCRILLLVFHHLQKYLILLVIISVGYKMAHIKHSQNESITWLPFSFRRTGMYLLWSGWNLPSFEWAQYPEQPVSMLVSNRCEWHKVPLAACLRCRRFIDKAYLQWCSLKSSRAGTQT